MQHSMVSVHHDAAAPVEPGGPGAPVHASVRVPMLGLSFDRVDARRTLALLEARRPGMPLAYVVTPNVQHVVAADRDPALKDYFAGAWLSLCDSHPVRMLARRSGVDLSVVTGSDLTVAMFDGLIGTGDRIAVICASDALGAALRVSRPDIDWDIMVPPVGTAPGTPAFDDCVDFIAGSTARFIFVCLGAPKSEMMCHAAARRPGATGTALCTGAALEFMLGLKTRAPRFYRRMGIEWVYRMLSEPHRLARRYLTSFVPLARIWLRHRRDVAGS